DRVHDEERARTAVGHQATVFRVEPDIALGGERVLDDALRNLVDRQGGVAAGSACDTFASACRTQPRHDRESRLREPAVPARSPGDGAAFDGGLVELDETLGDTAHRELRRPLL